MSRTMPWHSIDSDVYHNDTACNAGKNVKPENRRSGASGKRLCRVCERLNETSTAPQWGTMPAASRTAPSIGRDVPSISRR